MKSPIHLLALAGTLAALTAFTNTTQAAPVTIQSDAFSFGYGFGLDGNGQNSWNTTETSDTNTNTTQGNFTFTPVLNGIRNSNGGITFFNRIPEGVEASGVSAYMSSVSINAAWTGILPPDATNVEITLHITSLSVWANNIDGEVETWFAETTPGNLGTSSAINAPRSPNFTNAAGYSQLIWSPGNYTVDGLSIDRLFTVTDTYGGYSDFGYTVLDGFEIEGYITVSYEAIPEPSAVAFLLLGIGGAIGMGRLQQPGRNTTTFKN